MYAVQLSTTAPPNGAFVYVTIMQVEHLRMGRVPRDKVLH